MGMLGRPAKPFDLFGLPDSWNRIQQLCNRVREANASLLDGRSRGDCVTQILDGTNAEPWGRGV